MDLTPAGLGLGLLLAAPCLAAPPANVAPDPVLREWFKSLRQPGTQRVCCDVSDCRFVVFRVLDGQYDVEIEGWRYRVPPSVIVEGLANPTGNAVACYTYAKFEPPLLPGVPRDHAQDVVEILCFVPPRPPS